MSPPSESKQSGGRLRIEDYCSTVFVVLLLGLLAWTRLNSDYMRRVLETDELITLQNYTWKGVHEDGSRRELRSIADAIAPESPSLRRFALGIYCSTGRWTEPNNHVPYSLAVNAALCLPVRADIAIRLPALLFALAFAAAMFRLSREMGLGTTGGLVAVLCFCSSYVAEFSQTARGYTLSLWMCAESIRLIVMRTHGRHGLRDSMLLGVVSVLQVATLVNMSIDWVVPSIFVLMIVAARDYLKSETSLFDVARSVSHEHAVALSMVATFLVSFFLDRFPALISSARQYGVEWRSASDAMRFGAEVIQLLTPGGYVVLLIPAIVGVLLAIGSSAERQRVVGALLASVLIASIVHFAVGRKFSYPRNLGYLIPFGALGIGILVESLGTWLRLRAVTHSAVLLLAAGSCYLSFGFSPQIDVDLKRLTDHLSTLPAAESGQTLLLGRGVAAPSRLYFPASYLDFADAIASPVSNNLSLLIVEKTGFPVPFGAASDRADDDPDHSSVLIGPYRLRWCHCRATLGVAMSDVVGTEANAFGWVAGGSEQPVSADTVLAPIEAAGLTRFGQYERYQVKLDVYSRLSVLLVSLESDGDRSKVKQLDDVELRRFGTLFVIDIE